MYIKPIKHKHTSLLFMVVVQLHYNDRNDKNLNMHGGIQHPLPEHTLSLSLKSVSWVS